MLLYIVCYILVDILENMIMERMDIKVWIINEKIEVIILDICLFIYKIKKIFEICSIIRIDIIYL